MPVETRACAPAPDPRPTQEVNMATTQQMLDVSEMGAKSKEELLGLASDVGLNDTNALATLHKEDLLSRLFQLQIPG